MYFGFQDFEEWFEVAKFPVQDQLKRGLSSVKLIAFVFEFFDMVDNILYKIFILRNTNTEFMCLVPDIALTCKF